MTSIEPIDLAAMPQDEAEAGRVDIDLLYRSHWAELVRFVQRSFGVGPPDPEDVAQTAFAHFAALARPNLVENPRAFLFQAARNFMIDEYRRASVRKRASDSGLLEQTQETLDECHPERVVDGKLRMERLEVTIRGLPTRMQKALIMHRFDEMSYVEIARQLGVSQTEAKRLVAKALLICTQASRQFGKKK